MAACVDQELLLGGLVDNELDAANVAMVEAHVARCEGCREELDRLQALRNLLRSDGVRHTAPKSLTRRIAAMPELSPKVANDNRVVRWLAPGLIGAVAASLAMVTLIPRGRTPWSIRSSSRATCARFSRGTSPTCRQRTSTS